MNIKPNDELHRLIVDTINAGLCKDVQRIDYYDLDLLNGIANVTDNYDIKKVVEYIYERLSFLNRASSSHFHK